MQGTCFLSVFTNSLRISQNVFQLRPNSSQNHPSLPSNSASSLSFKSIKSSCAATHTLGCGAVYWSKENTPRTTFKESRLSPLPAAIDCQAPQPGWNFMPTSPVHAAIWSRLSLSSSCAHCHSCYEFTCAFALLCLENTAPS